MEKLKTYVECIEEEVLMRLSSRLRLSGTDQVILQRFRTRRDEGAKIHGLQPTC